jgi:4-hydroxy-tetrahydrodipicolinate synthase
MAQSMELVQNLPEDFTILSGDDDLAIAQIAIGFDGVISVAANCFTNDFSTMISESLKHNFVAAKKLHYKLLNGISLLFTEGNPPGVKAVLHKMDICENECRLPVVPVSDDTSKKIDLFLKTL